MFSGTFSKAFAMAAISGAILLVSCAGVSLQAGSPARSDEVFGRIQRGMTQDDVQRLLGSPDETMSFPLSQTQAWDYRYQDTWGYIAVFSVTFDAAGRAVSTFSRRINAGGDHASL